MGFEFAPIEAALAVIRRGKMVVVVDDPDRENEGDLIMAAAAATPESMAFIVRHTSGLVCVGMPCGRLDALELPLMVPENTESMRTAFTVSVDYRHGTSTGISAADRAATCRALVHGSSTPSDFSRPGHIFPLRAVRHGTLRRRGHTESAVDLTRLAGVAPGGILCEVVNDDGSMARVPDLQCFAKRHDLLMITIADLVAYRLRTEPALRRLGERRADAPLSGLTTAVYEDANVGRAYSAPDRIAAVSKALCAAQ